MTRQRNEERQKGKRKTKGKDKQGKTMNKWAYKKLPTYKTHSKIILKMPKAEIPVSKQEFFFNKQPSSSL
jgi:hypothetical protein